MRILFVSANNFRSFSKLNWKLDDTGLILIDGVNQDTGRSNGVGKTTLIDSIFWCLYGYLPKWGGPKGGPSDAVIKLGTENCAVTVSVENNGDTYQIVRRRGKSAGLTVSKNQGTLDGKKSDLESRIPELIGMSAEQFLISVYISQDRDKSFYSMSDTERTKLLSTIAGLENLNRALEKAKDKRTSVNGQIKTTEGAVAALEVISLRLPAERISLEHDRRTAETRVTQLSKNLADVTELALFRNEEAERSYQSALKGLNQETQDKTLVLDAQINELNLHKTSLNSNVILFPKIETHFEANYFEATKAVTAAAKTNELRIKMELANAQKRTRIGMILDQLEQLHGGNCAACNQALPDAFHAAQASKLVDQAQALEKDIVEPPPAIEIDMLHQAVQEAQGIYLSRKRDIEEEPKKIKMQIELLQRDITQLTSEKHMAFAKLNSESAALTIGFKNSTFQNDSSTMSAQREFEQAERAVEQIDSQMSRIQRQIEELDKDILDNKTKLSELNKELDEVLDLIDLFGPKGFRAVCFEGLVDRISARAGSLLSLMTDNVYSTRIDQLGETSKGEDKLILRPIITKGGLEVSDDFLSGGFKRTAMLAYDISVSEAVGDSNVLFLDEALDGLDGIGKNEAMKLLEEVSQLRAVLLIDHTSEIASAVQKKIVVLMRGATSTLQTDNQEIEGDINEQSI